MQIIKASQGILFLPSIPFFFLHKRYGEPSFGIFHKNFLQKSLKKLQVHTAVNTSSRWKRFNPLSPSIHIQILQIDLHTFPFRIS